LTAEAAEKLARLKTLADEATLVTRLQNAEYLEQNEKLARLESDLELALRGFRQVTLVPAADRDSLRGNPDMVPEEVGYKALPEEDVQIRQLREHIRHCKAEKDRADRNRMDRQERASAHRSIIQLNLIPWIERWPSDARLKPSQPVVVNSKLLGNLQAALDKCRGDNQHLTNKRAAVLAAPLSSTEAKRRARVQVMSLVKQGEPTVFDLIEHRKSVFRWPLSKVKDVPDAIAILAWYDPEGLIRRIEETIDQRADDANSLSDAEMAKQVKEIDAALLYSERLEEAVICAAEQVGQPMLRRVDADPRAVLGLSDAMPPE